jgi:ABC-type transporter Mla subunit MlaD
MENDDLTALLASAQQLLHVLVSTMEGAAETLQNINSAAVRINSLLDEMEEPLRTVLPFLAQTAQQFRPNS